MDITTDGFGFMLAFGGKLQRAHLALVHANLYCRPRLASFHLQYPSPLSFHAPYQPWLR